MQFNSKQAGVMDNADSDSLRAGFTSLPFLCYLTDNTGRASVLGTEENQDKSGRGCISQITTLKQKCYSPKELKEMEKTSTEMHTLHRIHSIFLGRSESALSV